ncbi:MAG TPA: hypothetical protein VHX65_12560 [Pirellulales bacterium]|nr:hypothetical protein [Pirellulales bacterium]
MLSRDGSRSTLYLLLVGAVLLASARTALAQAAPPAAPLPPAIDDRAPTAPSLAPTPGSNVPPSPTATPSNPGQNTPASMPAPQNAPPPDNGSLLAYSLASVPDMIGDSPSTGRYAIGLLGRYPASIPLAGGDGYAKIGDDTSPVPTDRVFFDYNYFDRAVQTGSGAFIGLNRFTFGVEKTFFDGWCSIEVETPIDTGLNDTQFLGGPAGASEGTVFGNMALTLKCLIYQSEGLAVAAGSMVDLPTAPNARFVNDPDSITVRNDSVHVAPFVGFAFAPNCDFFAIGFVQADFDTNGDPVYEHFPTTDPYLGRFRDPSLLYLDLSTGYWLFRDEPACGRYLTGIAPVVELHYTTNLQNYRGVDGAIQPLYAGTDCLNLTAGLHFQMGPCSMLTLAGVVPLTGSERDREFDSEATAQFDRRF